MRDLIDMAFVFIIDFFSAVLSFKNDLVSIISRLFEWRDLTNNGRFSRTVSTTEHYNFMIPFCEINFNFVFTEAVHNPDEIN